MRVTRWIVLTLLTKRSTILAVLKIKFSGFENFVSSNAYFDQSRHEKEIREQVFNIMIKSNLYLGAIHKHRQPIFLVL